MHASCGKQLGSSFDETPTAVTAAVRTRCADEVSAFAALAQSRYIPTVIGTGGA